MNKTKIIKTFKKPGISFEMKYIHNYIYNMSIEKMLLCFIRKKIYATDKILSTGSRKNQANNEKSYV